MRFAKKTSAAPTILRTIEFKLYLNREQEETLDRWRGTCCWTYNQLLEARIKAHGRRRESPSYFDQQSMIKDWRGRMERLAEVPVEFLRDAANRVDFGMQAFFRNLKRGNKPGFPRFRPNQRYRSIEYKAVRQWTRDGTVYVPGIGEVTARGRFQVALGKQKLMRLVKRASGWYVQIVVDTGVQLPMKVKPTSTTGLDLGLKSFLVLSSGEKVPNPRVLQRLEHRLKAEQRRFSRKKKGSKNGRKCVQRIARLHERIRAQRRDFLYQTAHSLVSRFDLIGHEKLNIRGLGRSCLSKSIYDASWGLFLSILSSKAANVGRQVIGVDPRKTSQTCPNCGAIKPKKLSERVHLCPCGCILDRDQAAAMVIHARALAVAGANTYGGIGLCEATVDSGDVSRPVEIGSLGAAQPQHHDTTVVVDHVGRDVLAFLDKRDRGLACVDVAAQGEHERHRAGRLAFLPGVDRALHDTTPGIRRLAIDEDVLGLEAAVLGELELGLDALQLVRDLVEPDWILRLGEELAYRTAFTTATATGQDDQLVVALALLLLKHLPEQAFVQIAGRIMHDVGVGPHIAGQQMPPLVGVDADADQVLINKVALLMHVLLAERVIVGLGELLEM